MFSKTITIYKNASQRIKGNPSAVLHNVEEVQDRGSVGFFVRLECGLVASFPAEAYMDFSEYTHTGLN